MHQFIQVLKSDFERRKQKNSAYSLRAFARDLQVSKSHLHSLLNGNRRVTGEIIDRIGSRLSMNSSEIETLKNFEEIEARKAISPSDFSGVEHWYHFAILNLARLSEAKANPNWISTRLGLDIETTKRALDSLYGKKLITNDNGKLVRTEVDLDADFNRTSHSIRIHHSENLYRAEDALFNTAFDERHFASMTMAISKPQYKKICHQASIFFKKVQQICDQPDYCTEVYTAAIQIFPQTRESKNAH